MAEEVTNNTVVVTLIVAIIVSLGGTVVVLTKLTSLSPAVTGFATQQQSGQVNLTIADTLAITLSESVVDFGVCGRPVSTKTISSFKSRDQNNATAPHDGFNCSQGNLPRNITILNVGNIAANISMNVSKNGTLLLTDSNAKLYYAAFEKPSSCAVRLNSSYAAKDYTLIDKVPSTKSTLYHVCTRFVTGAPYPQLYVGFNITGTSASNTGGSNAFSTITIRATSGAFTE